MSNAGAAGKLVWKTRDVHRGTGFVIGPEAYTSSKPFLPDSPHLACPEEDPPAPYRRSVR